MREKRAYHSLAACSIVYTGIRCLVHMFRDHTQISSSNPDCSEAILF